MNDDGVNYPFKVTMKIRMDNSFFLCFYNVMYNILSVLRM